MIESAIAGEDIADNVPVYIGADGKIYALPEVKPWRNVIKERRELENESDTPTIVDAPR